MTLEHSVVYSGSRPSFESMTPDSDVRAAISRLGADSVYMLLHHGWSREPRANRWHFATRWARHLPVTIVVPERPAFGRSLLPEPRIANVRILRVLPNRGPIWGIRAQLQTGQILSDMERRNARAPLLWLYNAEYAEAFATVPAVARIHHVTENFFDFRELQPFYLDRLRFVAGISDLNVAVSDGCAAPLRSLVDPDRLMVASNGCDFRAYGADGPADPQVAGLRERFPRVAVFGGQVNDRLDFGLIERLSTTFPDTLFLFAGPVHLPGSAGDRWSALLQRPNVRSMGPVDPDRLPSIYRASDLGFIPYTHERWITENGFPLKTLEMAATGLPVVATFMRPLLAHAPPLTVAGDADEFVAAVGVARREPALGARLRALASANDYDGRFAAIVDRVAAADRATGPRMDALLRAFPDATVRALQASLRERWGMRHFLWHSRNVIVGRIGWIVDMLPKPLRERVVGAKRAVVGVSKVVE